MLKISLISMPFASLKYPSIALTQLKALADSRFGDRVRTRILYLHHDFACQLGIEVYELMNSLRASNAGIGDWLFRSLAFPDLEDNADAYFQRYFPFRDAELEARRRMILAKRAGLERMMEQLIDAHGLAAEDIVGFTSTFAQSVSSLAMARLIKRRNPAVTTLIGGANCEAPMGRELALHVPALDFVFSGAGLVSFPQFLECRLEGDPDGCHGIRGVFSRRNAGSPHLEGHGAMGEDLPISHPVPLDYDGFLASLAEHFPGGEVQPTLVFETSRGCWWGERAHCTFCGLNGGTMGFRELAPAQAIELFEDLFARYGESCPRFESVDNIMPRRYLTDVFPHLQTPPGVSIFYEVKADLKSHEMEVLAKAGVTAIQPGIEALATSTLKLMQKGVTAFQNINFLKNCIRYGLEPAWNILIGFPEEDKEVYPKYMADIPLLVHLPPPSGVYPVRFDRYSPYFTRAREFGLDLSPYDFYRYVYPMSEESLAHLAYYFEDRNYGAEYLSQMVQWKDRLFRACVAWDARWNGADGGQRATLLLAPRGTGGVVHDTRSGQPIEHEVDDLGSQILCLIDSKALRAHDIAHHCGVEEASILTRVAHFRRLGILFEEGDRLMSLVLAPAASPRQEPAVALATASV